MADRPREKPKRKNERATGPRREQGALLAGDIRLGRLPRTHKKREDL